jgi:hypothetical protein
VSEQPKVFWSRVHFLVRFLGLTGLAAAVVGLALALIDGRPPWANPQESWETVQRVMLAGRAETYAEVVSTLLAAGLVVALLGLLVELLIIGRMAAGRRSAAGVNLLLQVGLAVVLLVGINAWSFNNYLRFDWTRNRQFTLPDDLQQKLRELRGETKIVVYLPHQSFGQRTEGLDPKTRAYVRAAEQKVIEKLKDLVDQFREFGPQFRVVVLDVDDWQNFEEKRDLETKNQPELLKAIEETPENTIFIAGQGRLQRLSFSDLYLLDKDASTQDQDGKGNLVLLDQGIEPLARKVLFINEKKPIIGVAVIHELLTTQGRKDLPYTMHGLRKALSARGLEVRDIVLKRWTGFPPLQAVVYTPEDSKLDRFDSRLAVLDRNITGYSALLTRQQKLLDVWKTASLDELTKQFRADLGVNRVTREIRDDVIEDLKFDVAALQGTVADLRERYQEVSKKRGELNLDALAESRRMADVHAKLATTLADCDLLLVPRMTLRNVAESDENIHAWLHRLDSDAQVDVIRDFLKQGKPILACFGPTNFERPPPPDLTALATPDRLERMLAQLGVKLVNQTVLYDAESDALTGRAGGDDPFGGEPDIDVPPLAFDWKPGAGRPGRATPGPPLEPHPIARSMRLIARGIGRDAQGRLRAPDLGLRHPQPIYFEPPGDRWKAVLASTGGGAVMVVAAELPLEQDRLEYDPQIIMTGAASWNEEQPFPTPDRIPRFEPPKSDMKKGTVEEKRRGPFPIALALRTRVPADWYAEEVAKEKARLTLAGGGAVVVVHSQLELAPPRSTVRLAIIGHGGIFNGGELSAAREMLLLNTVNWLLGREQELVHQDAVWKYPRVELTPRAHAIWQWGAWLGLPALFAYLGLVVVLVRRLR